MKKILVICLCMLQLFVAVNAEFIEVDNGSTLIGLLQSGNDIKLMRNIDLDLAETVTIGSGKISSLELNNCTITCKGVNNPFSVAGKLTITGKGKIFMLEGGGLNSQYFLIGVKTGGNLNICGGEFLYEGTGADNCCDIIRVFDGGTFNMVNGTLCTSQSSTATIRNEKGTVNVMGGTIKNNNINTSMKDGARYAISTWNDGAITNILGGTIISESSLASNKHKGKVNISNAATITGSINACDTCLLKDFGPFFSQEFTASYVDYDRGTSNAFGTVCLPFTPEKNPEITYYKLGEMSGDGNVLMLEEVETPLPNVPYIYHTGNGTFSVKSASGVNFTANQKPEQNTNESGLSLRGVYERTYVFEHSDDPDFPNFETKLVDPNAYYISNGEFMRVDGYFSIKPFRAYISSPTAAYNEFSIALSDLTASSSAEGDSVQPIEIYDLAGNLRQNLQKGINIVKLSNGKVQKIMVK